MMHTRLLALLCWLPLVGTAGAAERPPLEIASQATAVLDEALTRLAAKRSEQDAPAAPGHLPDSRTQ